MLTRYLGPVLMSFASRHKKSPRIGFIGAGRVGSALAWHCRRLGYGIAGITDKRPKQAWLAYGWLKIPYQRLRPRDIAARSDVLFLTVPDGSIEPEFSAVRRWILPGTIVAHCSGALGTDAFPGAQKQGLETLALHPVQTFTSHSLAIQNLPGSHWTLEGSPKGLQFGRRLVRQLKGRALVVRSADRPLYHAMCVIASNFLNCLLDASETIAENLGLSRAGARRMLLPLMRAVLDSSERLGPVRALTGPAQRGDAETLERHLSALGSRLPELVPLYRIISLRLLELANRQGLNKRAVRRIRESLEKA
ncbi:MAG: DUF2520 domain-containing protein [candidate division WOR-3 bacterium]